MGWLNIDPSFGIVLIWSFFPVIFVLLSFVAYTYPIMSRLIAAVHLVCL